MRTSESRRRQLTRSAKSITFWNSPASTGCLVHRGEQVATGLVGLPFLRQCFNVRREARSASGPLAQP